MVFSMPMGQATKTTWTAYDPNDWSKGIIANSQDFSMIGAYHSCVDSADNDFRVFYKCDKGSDTVTIIKEPASVNDTCIFHLSVDSSVICTYFWPSSTAASASSTGISSSSSMMSSGSIVNSISGVSSSISGSSSIISSSSISSSGISSSSSGEGGGPTDVESGVSLVQAIAIAGITLAVNALMVSCAVLFVLRRRKQREASASTFETQTVNSQYSMSDEPLL